MGRRVEHYDNGCVVAVSSRPVARREILVDLRYATGVMRQALAIEAERIWWVEQVVRLLSLMRTDSEVGRA